MWKTLAYNAANFFAALLGGVATMTWNQPTNAGVVPPNVNTFRYRLEEDAPDVGGRIYGKLHLAIDFLNGTVTGNTANNWLAIKLPEGRWCGFTTKIPCFAEFNNNGTPELIHCIVSEYQDTIYFRRLNANWPVSTSIRLMANMTLETVQPFQL